MMNAEKIEALLERIAIALERLAERFPVHGGPATAPVSRTEVIHDEARAASPPDSALSDPSKLEPFLHSKGIRIKACPAEDPADHVIDSLSVFLGDHYDAISSLLGKIKRAMQNGMPITENLKGRPQQHISDICQFCTRLHEVAFLEQYQYLRSPTYVIKAKTTTLPKAQRFFGGQWLERFILQKVKTVHAIVAREFLDPIGFEYLINPQITLPNGDDFELDILAAIGSSIYWIEAKSGDYQQHVAKYSRFARLLGLGSKHSFMVLTDVPEDRCEALSSLFSMTVCNLQTFEERLLAVARKDSSHDPASMDGAASVT